MVFIGCCLAMGLLFRRGSYRSMRVRSAECMRLCGWLERRADLQHQWGIRRLFLQYGKLSGLVVGWIN
jgi:hypothetical protein